MQHLTLKSSESDIANPQGLSTLVFEGEPSDVGQSHPRVTLEAVTPKAFRIAGAGLTIHYGIHSTPFGELLIATTPGGICNLHFVKAEEEVEQVLHSKWKNAVLINAPSTTQTICDRIFAAAAPVNQEPIALWVKATDFQLQVWRALLTIPFGQVTTYQAIATMIGKPTAARAAGNAISQNPIAYLIPCHRVIRESGALGGYYWGLERKAAILEWEASKQNTCTGRFSSNPKG